jgi:hypothetical protein
MPLARIFEVVDMAGPPSGFVHQRGWPLSPRSDEERGSPSAGKPSLYCMSKQTAARRAPKARSRAGAGRIVRIRLTL